MSPTVTNLRNPGRSGRRGVPRCQRVVVPLVIAAASAARIMFSGPGAPDAAFPASPSPIIRLIPLTCAWANWGAPDLRAMEPSRGTQIDYYVPLCATFDFADEWAAAHSTADSPRGPVPAPNADSVLSPSSAHLPADQTAAPGTTESSRRIADPSDHTTCGPHSGPPLRSPAECRTREPDPTRWAENHPVDGITRDRCRPSLTHGHAIFG